MDSLILFVSIDSSNALRVESRPSESHQDDVGGDRHRSVGVVVANVAEERSESQPHC